MQEIIIAITLVIPAFTVPAFPFVIGSRIPKDNIYRILRFFLPHTASSLAILTVSKIVQLNCILAADTFVVIDTILCSAVYGSISICH